MPPPSYRGCWHGVSRGFFFESCHNRALDERALQAALPFLALAMFFTHSRDIAGSGFRPLSNIPHCCLPTESGPCLSPSVADRPKRSAKHLRLGQPLPNQLPNTTQAHQTALFSFIEAFLLSFLWDSAQTVWQIPTRYAPVRHFVFNRGRPKTTFDLHVLSISLAFILSQDQTRFFGKEGPLLLVPGKLILAGVKSNHPLRNLNLN